MESGNSAAPMWTVSYTHLDVYKRQDLGYTEVQCVVVHIEDEHKVKALNIALNKITGAWNEQLLADLLVDCLLYTSGTGRVGRDQEGGCGDREILCHQNG